MLVDQQRAGGHLSYLIQAIEVAHLFVQEAAVLEAVVVDSGWCEGIADEEDSFGTVLFDEHVTHGGIP